ncbi:MAG: type II/IV secretion system protein [Phycisphaerales bacterium]|nr:type II/IV secretion system protein [Phycisphaerales bacterium]
MTPASELQLGLGSTSRTGGVAESDAAKVRDRCATLGISWLEKTPETETSAIALISAEVAVRVRAVPLRMERGRLVVAMFNPLDVGAADEIAALAKFPVTRVGVEPDAFGELMRRAYGTTAARIAESLAGTTETPDEESVHNMDAIDAADVHRMAEQPTLINLVNLFILEAIQGRASDIHIEPFESDLKIKYRIDGVLIEQPPPPKHLQAALIGRVKIMAMMNIAERYVPQDGHITLRFEGRKVDLRVSTVPTIYGESVVMRILDKSNLPLDLASLGMNAPHRAAMDRLIEKPHGLILVTGPTGSGKTTTLYAALSKLYDPRKKIITIEDPVEYELSGVNQIPVNPKRGLTFSIGLRAILRQDPDVILVGEVRDNETVDIAIRSALTGHLILSTLHTNDAISSVGRLVDMGAEPFLVASVLEGLLAQRLGRRLCNECKIRTPFTEATKARLSAAELLGFGGTEWKAVGCEECKKTGFRSRLGFFELIRMNPALRNGITKRFSVSELSEHLSSDFENMRQDGMRKAQDGWTTVSEVLRATQDVDDTHR